jgi:hypothetical protein
MDIQFDLTEPAGVQVTNNTIPNSCGLCDGEISLSVSGGVAPYSFNWNSGGNSNTETNLCSGVYIVDIADATGCSQQFTFTMNSAPAPSAVLTVTDEQCASVCDGEIASVISGGTSPYTLTWLDGTGNPIGQTSVTATD